MPLCDPPPHEAPCQLRRSTATLRLRTRWRTCPTRSCRCRRTPLRPALRSTRCTIRTSTQEAGSTSCSLRSRRRCSTLRTALPCARSCPTLAVRQPVATPAVALGVRRAHRPSWRSRGVQATPRVELAAVGAHAVVAASRPGRPLLVAPLDAVSASARAAQARSALVGGGAVRARRAREGGGLVRALPRVAGAARAHAVVGAPGGGALLGVAPGSQRVVALRARLRLALICGGARVSVVAREGPRLVRALVEARVADPRVAAAPVAAREGKSKPVWHVCVDGMHSVQIGSEHSSTWFPILSPQQW